MEFDHNLVESLNGRGFYASDDEITLLIAKGLVKFAYTWPPPAVVKVYRSLVSWPRIWKVIPKIKDGVE